MLSTTHFSFIKSPFPGEKNFLAISLPVTGSPLTLTVTESVATHPLVSAPLTVNTVATWGVATGLAMVESDNSFPGCHRYVASPEAVSCEVWPSLTKVGSAEMVITGEGNRVIAWLAVIKQPLVAVAETE